jgi:hypothetical protein
VLPYIGGMADLWAEVRDLEGQVAARIADFDRHLWRFWQWRRRTQEISDLLARIQELDPA